MKQTSKGDIYILFFYSILRSEVTVTVGSGFSSWFKQVKTENFKLFPPNLNAVQRLNMWVGFLSTLRMNYIS